MHVACQTNAPLEVLVALVERDPAALHMADHNGAESDASQLPQQGNTDGENIHFPILKFKWSDFKLMI